MRPADPKELRDRKLRAAAEARLAEGFRDQSPARTAEDLLLELHVHQIELEMQNETLRQAQNALEQSRDRYVDLYEFAPVGYLTVTCDGLIDQINLTGCRLLRVERKHLLNKRFASFVVPRDHDRWSRHFMRMAKGERQVSAEVVLQRGDGSVLYAKLDCRQDLDKPDSPPHGGLIRMALHDISERKLAEAALTKAQTLQSAIFNSANFSSIATDASGVVQLFNVGAERMLGYSSDDVINKLTPADISDPQELIARAQALSAELSTPIEPGFEALVYKASREIEDIYELTYVRKDGSRFPAVVSVTALRDDQSTIIGYLLIGTDNTERKRVEAQRSELDQRLHDLQFYTRSLIESSIDALVATNPVGIITDVNRRMETLTGCTRDELIGAPFNSYFTDPERAAAAIELALRGETVTDYELTARNRSGSTTEVSYNASMFHDRNGVLQGVFASARDVTERQRAAQTLRESNVELQGAKNAAEKANLAKSDFLSGMSHELRSPLNAILGFAQLMESSSPPPNDSDRESIAHILHAGWHLLKLINEILDLAVIESGKLSVTTEPVSLTEVLWECQTMMEPQARQRELTMAFPSFESPVFVGADRTRLKQIVINLLSNAIKFNKVQGTIVVQCSAAAPGRTRISVSDTGAGLSADRVAQLFEPFNRLGQGGEGGVAGTGIGLVLTKRLVESMGGVIGVDSVVGEGSVFWFELFSSAEPVVVESADAASSDEALVQPGAPIHTLLYVEDNQANTKVVEQLIARRPDVRLLTAGDGLSGVDLARSALPTVIIMDINLPGISGVEAMQILRDDPATAHIPVVALSANAMLSDVKTGLKLGFYRYLTKPIKIKEFMDTLNEALERALEQPSRQK